MKPKNRIAETIKATMKSSERVRIGVEANCPGEKVFTKADEIWIQLMQEMFPALHPYPQNLSEPVVTEERPNE